MKRVFIAAALLLAGAGYLYMQTTVPAPPLAARMPGGALLYLEAPDFGQTLRDWDGSAVKSAWLASANYATFSRSNLFLKLQEVYGQYGAAAGFEPGLKSVIEIAGTDSALALYGIRDVEFLYISRVPQRTVGAPRQIPAAPGGRRALLPAHRPGFPPHCGVRLRPGVPAAGHAR